MKSYLIAWLAVLAVAILPSHGYITEDVINWYKDMADEIPDGIEDEGPRKIEETVVGAPILQMAEAASEPNASVSCNCGDECAKLHISRLPPEVQVRRLNLSPRGTQLEKKIRKRLRMQFSSFSYRFIKGYLCELTLFADLLDVEAEKFTCL